MDLRRPALEQGSLGRFLAAIGDGTGGPAVQRAAQRQRADAAGAAR